MSAKIIPMPESTHHTPEQCFERARSGEFKEVMVVGFDLEGELVIYNSKMSGGTAVWLLEEAKNWAMGTGKYK